MTFVSFLMAVGLVGAALLIGIMLRTLPLREVIPGVGLWLGAMLLMGTIAAINLATLPVIEPLLLQYLLLAGVPLVVGFLGLSLLLQGNRTEGNSR